MTESNEQPDIPQLDEPLHDEVVRAIVHWLAHSTAMLTEMMATVQSEMIASLAWSLGQLDPSLKLEGIVDEIVRHAKHIENERQSRNPLNLIPEGVSSFEEFLEALRSKGVVVEEIDENTDIGDMIKEIFGPPSSTKPKDN